ncbi:VanZ family protein [Candidatus Neomarinimicrobiota bacterium]
MRLSLLWAILYALLIIVLSTIPGQSYPDTMWLSQDKIIHFCEYGIFAILLSRAFVSRATGQRQVLLFALVIAGTFGALDETYQLLIPGRDSSYADWIADVTGALFGSFLYIRWKSYRDQASAG